MNHSPLETTALFHIGPVAVTEPVIITWVIMAFLTLFAVSVTRRLSLLPSKAETVLELFVGAIDDQIRATMQVEPGPYRALIGTIFIFILVANWSSLVPGVEAPTAHLETDAAFGAIVFCATIFYGVRVLGLSGVHVQRHTVFARAIAEPRQRLIGAPMQIGWRKLDLDLPRIRCGWQ
jgi:F-type H+-transporting ATPase subunit a